MPRPTKLNEEVITEIERRLMMGASINAACDSAGVSEESFHRWKRKVKAGRGDRLQKKLIRVVTISRAEIKQLCEAGILGAGKKNWQAFAWMLERRYPSEYALKGERGDAAPPPKIIGAKFSLWAPDSETPEPARSSSDGSMDTTRSQASDDSTREAADSGGSQVQ